MVRTSVALLVLVLGTGCASGPGMAELLARDHVVVVATRHTHRPWIGWAQHSAFLLKDGAASAWEELEVQSLRVARTMDDGSVTFERRPGVTQWRTSEEDVRERLESGELRPLSIVAGDKARKIIADLRARAAEYDEKQSNGYRMWPGPNSNTFVDRLGHEVDGLRFELDHNAVGKDFAMFRLGRSTAGTGLALNTLLLGVETGLREGLELHFLQLTLGVSLYPPALKLPFLPRLGFEPFVLVDAAPVGEGGASASSIAWSAAGSKPR